MTKVLSDVFSSWTKSAMSPRPLWLRSQTHSRSFLLGVTECCLTQIQLSPWPRTHDESSCKFLSLSLSPVLSFLAACYKFQLFQQPGILFSTSLLSSVTLLFSAWASPLCTMIERFPTAGAVMGTPLLFPSFQGSIIFFTHSYFIPNRYTPISSGRDLLPPMVFSFCEFSASVVYGVCTC